MDYKKQLELSEAALTKMVVYANQLEQREKLLKVALIKIDSISDSKFMDDLVEDLKNKGIDIYE